MTDVKVEQCDIDRADEYNVWSGDGKHWIFEMLAAHRQAAEKATRESIADELTAYCRKMNAAGREASFYDAVRAIRSQNDG